MGGAVRKEREREGEPEIGQGSAAERKGKSGQRAERRRIGREGRGRSERMEKCKGYCSRADGVREAE